MSEKDYLIHDNLPSYHEIELDDRSKLIWYLEARMTITTAVCITAIIFGVLFKTLVIIIILLQRKVSKAPAMNWLILSLMAAGLLHLLFVVPMNIAETTNRGWHFGENFCKVHRYTWFVCLYSIAYHLVLILVYLFLSLLLQRMGNSTLEKPFVAVSAVTTLWVVILAANSSNLLSHGVMDDIPNLAYCYPKKIYSNGIGAVRKWMLASFLSMYLIPLLLMAIFTGLVWWVVCTRSAPAYRRFDSDDSSRTRWDYCVTSSIVSGMFIICWSPRLIHAMKFAFVENIKFDFREIVASDVYAMCLHAVFPLIVPVIFLVCVRDYRTTLASWKSSFVRFLLNKFTGNQILVNESPILEEPDEL